MKKSEKERIDNLWFNTDVYTWLNFLTKGEKQKALDYVNELQKDFEKKYGEAAICCGKYIFWRGERIAERLAKELKTWDKYIEYLKTLDNKMVEVLYETDIFDSYLLKKLI